MLNFNASGTFVLDGAFNTRIARRDNIRKHPGKKHQPPFGEEGRWSYFLSQLDSTQIHSAEGQPPGEGWAESRHAGPTGRAPQNLEGKEADVSSCEQTVGWDERCGDSNSSRPLPSLLLVLLSLPVFLLRAQPWAPGTVRLHR